MYATPTFHDVRQIIFPMHECRKVTDAQLVLYEYLMHLQLLVKGESSIFTINDREVTRTWWK